MAQVATNCDKVVETNNGFSNGNQTAIHNITEVHLFAISSLRTTSMHKCIGNKIQNPSWI